MTKYAYVISGTAGFGQVWHTEGVVTCNSFDLALANARAASFHQLTVGEAVYGSPGVGCDGPYKYTRFFIQLLEEEH